MTRQPPNRLRDRLAWVAAVVVAWALVGVGTASASWTIHSAVTPAIPSGQLQAASCWSTRGCIAVGSAGARSGIQTAIAERWNGQRWAAQRIPIPTGTGGTALDGIACVSRRLCVAVGGVFDRSGQHELALIERWNGRHWSVVSNPGGGQLNGVSCPSRSACEAVGADVIERWNGAHWTVVHSLGSEQYLASVSCASARRCMAVGEAYGESTGFNFAERYDGRKWVRQSIPTPGNEEDVLTGVSCASTRVCIATGATVVDSGATYLTITERWNGSKWRLLHRPNGNDSQTLSGLSCTAANACVAVGTYTTYQGDNQPLVERWNGRRWLVWFTARPRDARAGTFAGVACLSARMCDAVGSFNQQPRDSYPLAEQIVGSRWRVTPTAGFVGGASGTLQGVSCAAADACTAVGNYVNRAGQQATLAEREVAGRWSVQSSPTPRGATGSTLTAVSCATDSACAAVGQYCKPAASCDADPPGLPLAEIWDGSHWSTVPVPAPPGSGMGQLGAVSCATPTWCIAVGYREVKGNASLISPLIEVWNGSNWTSEQGPVPPNSNDTRLGGVSCSSPTACTAVGSSDEASGTEPFVEVWDGSSWAVRIPPANEPEGRLEGVSCWAPLSCVAVGEVFGGGTLIETSAGSVWSATTNSGAGQPSMAAVSCQPADDCLAVGDPISHAMGAIGWDGQTWAAQEVAGPVGTTQAQFNAVSCPPAGRCVAVGEFATNLNQSQPLIEERP